MHPFHRLAEFGEDWQYLTHQDGIISTLPIVARDIVRLPYRHLKFIILARSLAESLLKMQPKIPLETHRFEMSHLELVRAIDRPSEARHCERRLRSGQRGLVAFHQGQIAGYAWGCCPVDWDLERVHILLEPGDILCTDVYTAPALRGKGVQTALTVARFQMFRDLGFHRAICYIEIHNAPSLAVWKRKFNAQTIGEIDFRRVGPWYRVHYTYCPIAQESDTLDEEPISQFESLIGGSG